MQESQPRTLTPVEMTDAELITLRAYPALFLLLGALYLFQPDHRLSSDAFDLARGGPLLDYWTPPVDLIDVWGVLFAAIGLVELVCLLRGAAPWARATYRRALIAGTFVAGFWTVLVFGSALDSPYVSFTSAVWIGSSVVFHFASAKAIGARS